MLSTIKQGMTVIQQPRAYIVFLLSWLRSRIKRRFATIAPQATQHGKYYFGWYMLEFKVKLPAAYESDNDLAHFYYNFTQSGEHEEQLVIVPFISGALQRRIIYLPHNALTRFVPAVSAPSFYIDYWVFKPLLPSFAIDRMSRRLARRHAKSQAVILQTFKTAAKQSAHANVHYSTLLYQAYDATFSPTTPNGISYKEWLAHVEQPSLQNMYQYPLPTSGTVFSVIMPVYNPNLDFLQQAIASVQQQYYPYWELCIADDVSANSEVRDYLQALASKDARIKVVFRERNGHISAASNSAASLATGDYVVLLDQDDELAVHALWQVWQALQANPQARLLYSDEDKLNEDGQRCDPHFKPKWNLALQLSHNYTSHLGVYETKLFRQVSGFRVGVEGAQDYDLFLRCLAALDDPEHEIVHIPHVLYHWRVLAGSTAQAASEKSYTWDAGIRALELYISLTKQQATVQQGLLPNTYEVRYNLPKPEPKVSLLVPTRDGLAILRQGVESVLTKTSYSNYELLIIDNNSQQAETLAYLDELARQEERVRVLSWPHPFNYSAINNFAARHAQGELLCLLNNDVEVIAADWLSVMVSHAVRAEIGCVGAKLLYSDGRIQHGGVILGIGGVAGHAHKYYDGDHHGYFSRLKVTQYYSAVTAACLLVRKVVYEQVGGLDEQNLTVAFNDIDFCLRVGEAGYQNIWTPYALLYHHESVSRGQDDTPAKQQRFQSEMNYMQQCWGNYLRADPCYSPHLSLEHEDFSLSDRAQAFNAPGV